MLDVDDRREYYVSVSIYTVVVNEPRWVEYISRFMEQVGLFGVR